MKFTTAFLLTVVAGTQAFQPVSVIQASISSTALRDADHIVEKAADAVTDAASKAQDAMEDAMPNGNAIPDRNLGGNGLSEQEEQEMWDAQRELQANRNAHSGSKEQRQEKYSGPPIMENDKHHELKEPWTKDDGAEDHYSVNGKL